MKNNKIGELLKTYRKINQWSVEDVATKLKEDYGFNIAEKTIYGWESNQAHPTCDTFVALCEMYHINNVADIFSQTPIKKSKDFIITPEERLIIEQFRKQPEMRNAVKKLLNIPTNTNKPV